MLSKYFYHILTRIGNTLGIKRTIDETEEDGDMNERYSKQRRIEKTEEQHFFTSDQVLRPSPNFRMPKKKPVFSCRHQQRSVPAVHARSSQGPHPGCSWFEDHRENIVEAADDEDVAVLGVWQDANTLKKRPVFRTGCSVNVDRPEDDDVQVIKMMDSHGDEILRSGNTISIFQTPSTEAVALSRQFTEDSGKSRKSQVLLQHLKSSHMKLSQDGNESQNGTSSRSSHSEEKRTKLALSESIRLEEKRQYTELLQRFTSVPLQVQSRQHGGVWNPSARIVQDKSEFSDHFDFAGHSREKVSKQCPFIIDLTKPQPSRPFCGKHRDVCRDREAQPYTASSKQDGDAPQVVEFLCRRTNSQADSLKSNYFCTEDLLTNIEEKYKRKHEARERQKEEEMLKALHFQKREKKLHVEALERMTNYLKITDAILDDEVIFEVEKVALPKLTSEMQGVIESALIPRPPNEVLVEAFGLHIKRHDMQTLADLNWLNDEVINFYMELLKKRGTQNNYPSVYTFNTFFYPRLLSGGHAALKRWTRKVDVFSFDLIIVPVHLGVHWCMAAIDFRNKTVKYYNSMGSQNNKCLESLMKYLQDESLDKRKAPFRASEWQTKNVQDIPQQMNGSDCGMFSCMYAEFICRNADITFTQEDMPYFRRKMVYEIYTCKLLM